MLRKKELKKLSFFLFLWWSHWIYKNIFFTSLSLSLFYVGFKEVSFRFYISSSTAANNTLYSNEPTKPKESKCIKTDQQQQQPASRHNSKRSRFLCMDNCLCLQEISLGGKVKFYSSEQTKRKKKVANSERVSLHSEFIAIKMRKGMKFQKNNTRYVGQWWFITMRYVDFFRATQRHISECLSGDSLIKHQMKRSMT